MKYRLIFILLTIYLNGSGQSYRWQQKVDYKIHVDFDDEKHQYKGNQFVTLWNKSPDTLSKLYFHLYFNAFQPGSDMDIRSQLISDPDPRIGKRIGALTENEIGFIEFKSIQHNGKKLKYNIEGTILIVELNQVLLPMDSVIIELEYKAQVPLQIRRSGRNNREGIDYSMAQWYPKLCNYDEQGWHTPSYVAREFYGPWGNFDVTIEMDSKFCLGATGILQNPNEVSCGNLNQDRKSKKNSWHFIAEQVHDFVWAAEPDYTHKIYTRANGCQLHFYYIENEKTKESWSQLPLIIDTAFAYIETHFGPYPYPIYSFIQAGDGGMEYPMATLITGNRPLISLVGVSIHELMHSWYQMMLATNESLYPWMDEGFTAYAEEEVMNHLKKLKLIPGSYVEDPHLETLKNYVEFIKSGLEEALSTHADHYTTNTAYGQASYNKGALCLQQLKNILGSKPFQQGMLNYYWKWRFRHPNPNDFFREMEKVSDMELDWFKEYFVYSTKKMDYGIDSVYKDHGKTMCRLQRIGLFPMPVELLVKLHSGKTLSYYIPLNLMLGTKVFDEEKVPVKLKPWSWINPFYTFEIDAQLDDIESIEIDPKQQILDINTLNNSINLNQLNR